MKINIYVAIIVLISSFGITQATAGPKYAALEQFITKQTRNDMMSYPPNQKLAVTCTGRFCCCNLRSRGIICAPKSKCRGGGFCVAGVTSCPK